MVSTALKSNFIGITFWNTKLTGQLLFEVMGPDSVPLVEGLDRMASYMD